MGGTGGARVEGRRSRDDVDTMLMYQGLKNKFKKIPNANY